MDAPEPILAQIQYFAEILASILKKDRVRRELRGRDVAKALSLLDQMQDPKVSSDVERSFDIIRDASRALDKKSIEVISGNGGFYLSLDIKYLAAQHKKSLREMHPELFDPEMHAFSLVLFQTGVVDPSVWSFKSDAAATLYPFRRFLEYWMEDALGMVLLAAMDEQCDWIVTRSVDAGQDFREELLIVNDNEHIFFLRKDLLRPGYEKMIGPGGDSFAELLPASKRGEFLSMSEADKREVAVDWIHKKVRSRDKGCYTTEPHGKRGCSTDLRTVDAPDPIPASLYKKSLRLTTFWDDVVSRLEKDQPFVREFIEDVILGEKRSFLYESYNGYYEIDKESSRHKFRDNVYVRARKILKDSRRKPLDLAAVTVLLVEAFFWLAVDNAGSLTIDRLPWPTPVTTTSHTWSAFAYGFNLFSSVDPDEYMDRFLDPHRPRKPAKPVPGRFDMAMVVWMIGEKIENYNARKMGSLEEG